MAAWASLWASGQAWCMHLPAWWGPDAIPNNCPFMLVAEQQTAKIQSVPGEPRAGVEQLVGSKAARCPPQGVCRHRGLSTGGTGYLGEDRTPLPGMSAVAAGGESLGKYLLCLPGLSHPM